MTLLIKSAFLNGIKQNILIEHGKISYIGPENQQADETINAEGLAALPGFINAHTHAAMALFRSYADDITLQEWLQNKIWPVESKLKPEHVYAGTKLACLEMIKSGTTCFNDMYFYPDQVARACIELGVRAVIAEPVIDVFKNDLVSQSNNEIKEKIDLLSKIDPLIDPSIAPHAIYTVTEEKLKWIAKFSAEQNILVHMHLSETEKENTDCIAQHGKTPVEYLKELNLLSPRLIAAHSVYLSEKDAKILAEHQAKLVNCPVANMKLSVGNALNFKMLEHLNCNVCLGTDGPASNNNLDMFQTMKTAALLQKHHYKSPAIMNAQQTFDAATIKAAEALRLNAGKLEEGRLADIILVDLNNPKLVPHHNLISSLVYSADSSCVHTTIINGKVVMRDRIVLGEEKIIENAKEAAEELCYG